MIEHHKLPSTYDVGCGRGQCHGCSCGCGGGCVCGCGCGCGCGALVAVTVTVVVAAHRAMVLDTGKRAESYLLQSYHLHLQNFLKDYQSHWLHLSDVFTDLCTSSICSVAWLKLNKGAMVIFGTLAPQG